MTTIETTDDYDRCRNWYSKKKPDELQSVLDNLDTLLQSLADGKPLKPFCHGFLKAEPEDVVRIWEGGNAGMAATRLYVYLDVARDTLHLLTIGDKNTQQDDIQLCKAFVKQIKSSP